MPHSAPPCQRLCCIFSTESWGTTRHCSVLCPSTCLNPHFLGLWSISRFLISRFLISRFFSGCASLFSPPTAENSEISDIAGTATTACPKSLSQKDVTTTEPSSLEDSPCQGTWKCPPDSALGLSVSRTTKPGPCWHLGPAVPCISAGSPGTFLPCFNSTASFLVEHPGCGVMEWWHSHAAPTCLQVRCGLSSAPT